MRDKNKKTPSRLPKACVVSTGLVGCLTRQSKGKVYTLRVVQACKVYSTAAQQHNSSTATMGTVLSSLTEQ